MRHIHVGLFLWVCQTTEILPTVSFFLHCSEIERETRHNSCPLKFLVSQEHQICVQIIIIPSSTVVNVVRGSLGVLRTEGSFPSFCPQEFIKPLTGHALCQSLSLPCRHEPWDLTVKWRKRHRSAITRMDVQLHTNLSSLMMSAWFSESLWERSLNDRMWWEACPTEERWQGSPQGREREEHSGQGNSTSEAGSGAWEILGLQRCVFTRGTFFRSSPSPNHT